MDRKIAAFIVAYIDEKLVNCENPRLHGKALKGDLNEIWRYRVGDYRILAVIAVLHLLHNSSKFNFQQSRRHLCWHLEI
jgi:mRNA-degrading endonuclease RelE of RelBE toxin-antitoxin system